MKTMEKNGKKLKGIYTLLQKTGHGVKMAADTGYKTGYFMAKHPVIKHTKDQIQKNYKVGLITFLGLSLSAFGLFRYLVKMKK